MANEEAEDDHLSVGVQLPNGEIQKPISGQHLYWIKPGKSVGVKVKAFHAFNGWGGPNIIT